MKYAILLGSSRRCPKHYRHLPTRAGRCYGVAGHAGIHTWPPRRAHRERGRRRRWAR